MKSIMKSFVFVAAVATALVSCEKNEIDSSAGKNEIKFSIKGQIDQTRTKIEQTGKVYTPKWNKGDEIGVFFGEIASGTKADATFANSAENGAVANFEGTSAKAAEEGNLKAVYPANAIYQGYADHTIGVELSPTQNPTFDSFDAKADILVSAPCYYMAVDNEVTIDNMYFSRIMSVVKINLNSAYADVQEQVVKKVKMTAEETLTGRARVDFDTRSVTEWTNPSSYVAASYDAENYICVNTADLNAAYLVVNPTTIASGSKLTFDITTENFEITKEVTLTKDIVLPKGDIAVINLNIEEANCTKIIEEADFTGDWVIFGTGTASSKTYNQVALKFESGNNLKGTNVTLDGDTVIPSDTEKIADAKMHIEKVKDGTYAGLYTIVDAGGKYLCTATGGNYLKGEATSSVNSYWEITEKDGEYSIIAIKSGYRNIMQYNPNNGNPLFACYTSASQKPVKLYPWANVKLPKNIIADNTIEVGAKGNSDIIEYTTQGIEDGATINIAFDGTVVNEATIDETSVLYSFTSNYGAEVREGSITLTLASDETVKKEIAVKQAGSELTVSTSEIFVPADDNEYEGSFTVTSDVFGGTIVSSNTNENEIMISKTFEAGETTIEIYCLAEAADEEQTIATLTVSRTENDPQAKTVVVKKAAKGSLPKLDVPANIAISDISAAGFTATWNSVEGAAGYAYKVTAAEAADVDAATAVAEGNATATTATIAAELTEGETYFFYVKSVGTDGVSDNSAWSPAATVIVENKPLTQEYTVKWTASNGALGSAIGSGIFKMEDFEWNYTRTLKSGVSYSGYTSNCIQLGKNGGVENITLTTSNIPGVIKNVSVECASYQGKHNIAITVGEDTYLAQTATSSWTTVGTNQGTGTSSGQIKIDFTGGTRALYIKSITVIYEN